MENKAKKDLKDEAEKRLKENPNLLKSLSRLDVERLVHELGTYQIELEMQNEDLRKAQMELEESRRRYAELFNYAPVGYFTLDRMGRILGVNQKGAELLRHKKTFLLGKPLSVFIHPDDKDVYRAHRELVGEMQTLQACEVRLLIGGDTAFVQMQSVPDKEDRLDEQGNPLYFRTAVMDITAIREAESERERARAAERAAREEAEDKEHCRLESMRALAGGISHDLNNLLVIITVNAELAFKENEDPDLRELVEGIDHAARRIGAISAQMLTYSGGMEFIREPLDLSRSVYETAHLLSATLSRKGTLKFNLAEGLPAIEADRSAFQQIVVNLLLNAADAVEGYRGTILISTGSVYADRHYLDRTHLGKDLPQGRYEFLEVLDDGVGMSSKNLDKIFEPFYTTKFTGRGMGLASVFGIVREHGGAIEVESAPGKGTRVRVLLPQPDQPPLLAGGEQERAEPSSGSGTLLLVDDEADVLNMTKKVLEMNGYKVMTAADGPEAIETFKNNSGRIRAVIIDLIMPEMPGDETSREIRNISAGVPIVLLSGYHELDGAALSRDFGVTAVIKKPYRIDSFLEMLQGIMEKPEG